MRKLTADETIKTFTRTVRVEKNTILRPDGFSEIKFKNFGAVNATIEDIPCRTGDDWLTFDTQNREQFIQDFKIDFDVLGGANLIVAVLKYYDINPKL